MATMFGTERSSSKVYKPKNVSGIVLDERIHYDYPDGLDLTPGSSLHNKLRDYVMERAYESSNHMSQRHNSWISLDEKLTAYIPLSEREKAIKQKDSRKPVSIVLPVSYATLETFLTYLTAAFLNDFLFQYDGIGPEDTAGAMKLQHLINHQFISTSMGLNLHTMWRDGLVYNLGGIAVSWEERFRFRRERGFATVRNALAELGIDFSPDEEFEQKLVYEGNRLHNMDAYFTLPYPHAPVYDVQHTEYTGWVRQSHYNDLLREENNGLLFNVRYLKRIDGRSSMSLVHTGRSTKTGLSDRGEYAQTNTTRAIDVVEMYIDIIPSEIGLGSSDYPERWIVGVAGDDVVVRAEPLGLVHDMAPLAICSPNSDGHSMLSASILEIGEGMSEFFTFLVNSRMANIRSALNLGLIFDPRIINMDDFSTADAGFRARINTSTFGLGVIDNAVKQLDIKDITAGHVGDAYSILDMNNRFLGTVDALQGVVRRGGERVTAEEISSTFQSALSRLEKMARIISMQAHEPLAKILAYNTQEFMTQETYVKLLGGLDQEIESEFGTGDKISVSPEDIDVDFNIIPHDGSTPLGGGNTREWVDLLINFMGKTPVGSKINFDKLFLRTARRLGEKNAHSLLKRINESPTAAPIVQEDEEVEKQVQAGNLVPFVGGGLNGQ